jgi:hypothetical protein
MIEGSGSGFVSLTNVSGSGSGRPKTYGSYRSSSATLDIREHFRGSSRGDEESGADEDIVRSMRNLPILETLPGSQGETYT